MGKLISEKVINRGVLSLKSSNHLEISGVFLLFRILLIPDLK